MLVCVAVLAWLWQLRLVGREEHGPGDQALASSGDRGREAATWSHVARALSADEELDQWRDCLECLRESLSRQPLTASVLGVHVGPSVVEVIWGGLPPRPRWPWHEPVSGWVWQARLGDVMACARAGEQRPPVLPLIKLGQSRLGVLFLNLEAFEVITVVEDAEERLGLRPWRQTAHALSDVGACEVVWLDASMPALEAVRAIHRRARAIAQGLAGTGWVSAVEARLGGGDPVRFRPLVVFIAGDVPEDDVADVVEAAGRNRAITCVLSGAHPQSDLALECHDGCVQIPFLSDMAVELPVCRVVRGRRRRQRDCRREDESNARRGVEPRGSRDASLPEVMTELDVMTPAVPLVVVRVLGSIEVEGASEPLGGKSTELAVYLACHPEGVSVDRMKAALWPVREPRPQTWMNRVSVCRQALGTAPDGEFLFPHFDHQLGRLDRRVRTDVEMLEAALERAVTDRAWALSGLRHALELVRGRPFEVPGVYEWAYEELHVADAERVVSEAAHRLAEVALEAGEGSWRCGPRRRGSWPRRRASCCIRIGCAPFTPAVTREVWMLR